MKTKSANDNLLTKKQKLIDASMQDNILYYPSLMGFIWNFYGWKPCNALKTGYRHLDFAENNSNSSMIKTALEKPFRFVQDGGLGLSFG